MSERSSGLILPRQHGVTAPGALDDWRKPVGANPAFMFLSHASRVLMLQGPVGPFFDRMCGWLKSRGAEVRRVVFQGGDEFDCQALQPERFTAPPAEWPAHFSALVSDWKPDCIVLFGQARHYHKVALERARAIDLPVVVLEEGYFRPGYVTMELGGVNGYSTTLDRFEWTVGPTDADAGLRPDTSEMHFQKMAWHACQHYLALGRTKKTFPHYQHHRCDDVQFYARYWVWSWFRKYWHRQPDYRLQRWLIGEPGHPQPYFFVPLQLEGDSQITYHSPFTNIVEFIIQVMRSFAARAPRDSLLVFRQHPHARGGPGHVDLIRTLATSLGVANRVHHMAEGDTPILAEHSMGTVVINSTVGLQALERGVPLIALGEALYRQPEFTFTGALDDFWDKRLPPDAAVTAAFLAQIKNLTQAPASVYALRKEKLRWTVPPR